MDQDFIETVGQNHVKEVPIEEHHEFYDHANHGNQWSRQDQQEIEDDPLTRQEETAVKEITFVLNGKKEKFVIAKEVEAVVDQFPDDEDFDFSI